MNISPSECQETIELFSFISVFSITLLLGNFFLSLQKAMGHILFSSFHNFYYFPLALFLVLVWFLWLWQAPWWREIWKKSLSHFVVSSLSWKEVWAGTHTGLDPVDRNWDRDHRGRLLTALNLPSLLSSFLSWSCNLGVSHYLPLMELLC